MKKLAIAFCGVALPAGPALAHGGAHELSGLMAGLAHVLGHADHALAIAALGIVAALAVSRGARARLAAFVRRRTR